MHPLSKMRLIAGSHGQGIYVHWDTDPSLDPAARPTYIGQSIRAHQRQTEHRANGRKPAFITFLPVENPADLLPIEKAMIRTYQPGENKTHSRQVPSAEDVSRLARVSLAPVCRGCAGGPGYVYAGDHELLTLCKIHREGWDEQMAELAAWDARHRVACPPGATDFERIAAHNAFTARRDASRKEFHARDTEAAMTMMGGFFLAMIGFGFVLRRPGVAIVVLGVAAAVYGAGWLWGWMHGREKLIDPFQPNP
jgi:hypothetical protein